MKKANTEAKTIADIFNEFHPIAHYKSGRTLESLCFGFNEKMLCGVENARNWDKELGNNRSALNVLEQSSAGHVLDEKGSLPLPRVTGKTIG